MMLVIGFVTKFWWMILMGGVLFLITRLKKEEEQGMNTTESGYINKNNQKNNGRTNMPGTDFGHWFYEMECLECGYKYHANGSNIYEVKCPHCQGGQAKKETTADAKSTTAGYINKNNQRNNGKTNKPGTGFGQWFYNMECLNCGHTYFANGHDIWLRKCPHCQGGRD